uniref:Methyltransferase FkbM family n=1 Tax=Rhodopseudomonas palustris (strain BisA53) TaxID=316055 RepID=Q07IR7_RHOP5
MPARLRSWAAAHLPARLMHRYRMLRHVRLWPYEPELAVLPRFLKHDEVAIDVGANVGVYSDCLAQRAKRVIALEPHSGCAAYLRRLALDRVQIVEAAVSDTDGTAELRIPLDEAGDAYALSSLSVANAFSAAGQAVRVEQVRTVTLDAIVARFVGPDERVGFVKIDVEGHELAVLNGSRGLLVEHRPVVLVETEFRHGGDPEAVLRLAAELGYTAYALTDGVTFSPVDGAILARRQSAALQVAGRAGGYLNNVFLLPDPSRASAATG